MGFIQIIDYSTSRPGEIERLAQEWAAATQGKRTATRQTQCTDRDQAGRYVHIVEFPSYDEAMRNSSLPETAHFAEQLTKLCDGPVTFRNLDVTSTEEL